MKKINKPIAQFIGILDFLWFFYKVDSKFRWGIRLAVIGGIFVVATSLFNYVGIIGIVLSLASMLFAFRTASAFGPGTDAEFYTMPNDNIRSADTDILFRHFIPSKHERDQEFRNVDPGFHSGEYAISSDSLNSWLFQQPTITYSVGRNMSYSFCENDIPGRFNSQMYYLHARVFGSKRTTNDKKFRIDSELKKGIFAIKLSKLRYYDGLVTNEAFRRSINIRPKGSTRPGKLQVDLRQYFPVTTEVVNGSSQLCLTRLNTKSVAGHVGISTLVISKDNYPILFEQSDTNELMAGKLVACGSGSVDYSDISRARTNSFLDVIKFSMAREFAEEGSQLKFYFRSNNIIKDIADNTMVIGYFRWIDRCGKPEFIGVTRSNKTKDEIEADKKEVLNWGIGDFVPIYSMSDFTVLSESIKKDRKIEMGLSSAMVLWRLVQIAEKDSDDPEKETLAKFLKIKNI